MKLFIIATPLGNLKDITLRAVEVLRSVDIIFCEDTRRTINLLNHFNIKARLERYNEHSEASVERALRIILSGKKAALVTDGGTPCISDPGFKLCERAFAEGIKVQSLPGPCAAVCALAGSGLAANSFVFLGFLPRKKQKIIDALKNSFTLGKAVVVYESPFRIVKLLEIIIETFGQSINVFVARELTKIHEEYLRGNIVLVYNELKKRKEIKGEITLVLSCKNEKKSGENNTPA